MNKVIQFYDENKNELLGSESILPFDNRLNNLRAISEAYNKTQKQIKAYLIDNKKYVKPKQCYASIMKNNVLLSGIYSLDNELYDY